MQLAVDRQHATARVNLGVVRRARGDRAGAIALYTEALGLDSDSVYTEALGLDSDSADAYFDLANALAQRGDRDGAVRHEREALRVRPDYPAAANMLRRALDSRPP